MEAQKGEHGRVSPLQCSPCARREAAAPLHCLNGAEERTQTAADCDVTERPLRERVKQTWKRPGCFPNRYYLSSAALKIVRLDCIAECFSTVLHVREQSFGRISLSAERPYRSSSVAHDDQFGLTPPIRLLFCVSEKELASDCSRSFQRSNANLQTIPALWAPRNDSICSGSSPQSTSSLRIRGYPTSPSAQV